MKIINNNELKLIAGGNLEAEVFFASNNTKIATVTVRFEEGFSKESINELEDFFDHYTRYTILGNRHNPKTKDLFLNDKFLFAYEGKSKTTECKSDDQ